MLNLAQSHRADNARFLEPDGIPAGLRHLCIAHLPETIDPAVLTRSEWAPYAAFVISAVVFRRFIDHDADEATFVPLSNKFLRRHVPVRVSGPLIRDLLGCRVLERDETYYFGQFARRGRGKCFCYRLGECLRGITVRPRVITHPELLRKMHAAWQADRAAITSPLHIALRYWHDQVEVLPDAPYGEHLLLDRLLDGERRFSVCRQGRIHHNVANLPRQYRQYVRLEGNEMESVDIATSQPLLLGLVLSGRAQGLAAEAGKGKTSRKVAGTPALYVPSSEPNLNVYLGHCLDGTIYDHIAAETHYSRDDVKPLFLAVIYGEPQHMNTKTGRAIGRLYPSVFDAVTELNHRLGHGGLPRLMQTIESLVMIGRVAGRLTRELPCVPLLTLHDSILIPSGHAKLAKQVIDEEWNTAFGVVPKTKQSTFTAPQPARLHCMARINTGGLR